MATIRGTPGPFLRRRRWGGCGRVLHRHSLGNQLIGKAIRGRRGTDPRRKAESGATRRILEVEIRRLSRLKMLSVRGVVKNREAGGGAKRQLLHVDLKRFVITPTMRNSVMVSNNPIMAPCTVRFANVATPVKCTSGIRSCCYIGRYTRYFRIGKCWLCLLNIRYYNRDARKPTFGGTSRTDPASGFPNVAPVAPP